MKQVSLIGLVALTVLGLSQATMAGGKPGAKALKTVQHRANGGLKANRTKASRCKRVFIRFDDAPVDRPIEVTAVDSWLQGRMARRLQVDVELEHVGTIDIAPKL